MFLRKHVIRQKMPNFAPLFGVVRAFVRYIVCRVKRFFPVWSRGCNERETTLILARSKAGS